MKMTFPQLLITIFLVFLGTISTRLLPFWIFPSGKPTPKYLQYLGKALPPAIFGMLIIYCLKEVNIFEGSHGLPELIAVCIIIALHAWKRQMLLSIAAGTISYMILVQFVF